MSEHLNQRDWRNLIEFLCGLKNPKHMDAALTLLLTHEEREDVNKRFLIIKHLLANTQTQRELAKTLNVSISKITRGSNVVKEIDAQLAQMIQTQK